MESLNERLSRLESTVYGPRRPERLSVKEDVVSDLLDVAKTCGNALEGRDRIAPIIRRTKELESYLDPSFSEAGVSNQVKANLILAQENKLRKTHELLERVEEGKKVLNSDAFT